MSVFLSRIVLIPTRSAFAKNISLKTLAELTSLKHHNSVCQGGIFSLSRQLGVRSCSSDSIQPVIALENATSPVKKKTVYKKAVLEDLSKKEGHYLALAYATANAYDLKGLKEALLEQKLYEPGMLKAQEIDGDVVIANAVYTVGSEPREIIFFKEGAVVFWNCTELEASNVLDFVRRYELESYPRDVVEREREIMTYVYQPNAKKCNLQESYFVMAPNRDNSLEKYTFSHAMAQSARLGAWEARLEALAASARAHSITMEKDGTTHLDKKEVVRKLGELFSLRHRINVESDLLDTPDVYWEEERLERLYSNTVAYFTIPRRTRVLNERLSHCVELLELLSSWAADRHHVRLEWMVIALILAEVCFELLHVFERYVLDRLPKTIERRRGRTVFADETEEYMFQDISILDT
ncbi:required for meiotic nuclear division protein 1 homolog [Leguminivora glycinivorella]|uniref:required for meiotic nuclear division protein 1 homolog n=1 Tax=Leguminivora glycinivorella TaxID=1035111 RepID=UPI00200F2183|nr:required for meiotic nuclear division protein 1 homolog [Leguminivora glycinivorella]